MYRAEGCLPGWRVNTKRYGTSAAPVGLESGFDNWGSKLHSILGRPEYDRFPFCGSFGLARRRMLRAVDLEIVLRGPGREQRDAILLARFELRHSRGLFKLREGFCVPAPDGAVRAS